MAYTLVLLRHGESEWNAKNLFTGWVDVALSEKGIEEAKRGGTLLTDAGVLPDVVHTSLLRRAITTANLDLDAGDCHWIPDKRNWRKALSISVMFMIAHLARLGPHPWPGSRPHWTPWPHG